MKQQHSPVLDIMQMCFFLKRTAVIFMSAMLFVAVYTGIPALSKALHRLEKEKKILY